uniref:Uncharacterized protein n=1 Tax=Helianthus annuus TaxID=4232 RepID=A0A251TID9_HELAN
MIKTARVKRMLGGNRVKKTTGKPNDVHPFLPSSSYSPNFRVKIRFYHPPPFIRILW